MLSYKGYTAAIDIDAKSGILYGQVIGIKDVVTFAGHTEKEVKEEFYKSVDVYLDFCQILGRMPHQPFSDKLHITLPPRSQTGYGREAKEEANGSIPEN
jgi:predicted HicB family RNase H-like nuclease